MLQETENNLTQSSVGFHTETCHLFSFVGQMTSFYVKYNTELK